MKESFLFMGHGSRDAGAVDECISMVRDVEQGLGIEFTPGFLELSEPLLFPEIVRKIDAGVRRFLCFPNMLLPGRHTMEHLPGVIGWAQRHFPDVEFYYGNFIGNHPHVLELLRANYRRARARLAEDPPASATAVVVVGRGSTSERSNRTFEKMVDRFRRQTGLPNVTFCYVSLAHPRIEETLLRLTRQGDFRHVLLLPYFLFTGVLIKRIQHQVEDFSRRHPSTQLVVGEYFGKDERLRDIVEDRVRQLADRSRDHRPNNFRQISENAGHHLHHLDVFGDEPAAQYLDDLPGCPEHRHPSRYLDEGFGHGHLESDHEEE